MQTSNFVNILVSTDYVLIANGKARTYMATTRAQEHHCLNVHIFLFNQLVLYLICINSSRHGTVLCDVFQTLRLRRILLCVESATKVC
jgi:hypothetical protein